MDKSSIIVCPNERLLNPESIKAFAKSNKDNWNLLLIDQHPELKLRLDNVYQAYLDQKAVFDQFKQYAAGVKEVSEQYKLSQAIWVSVNDWLVELEWIIEDEVHDSPEYLFDQMMAYNTLISSLLLMAVIPQMIWLDARDFIKTDENYGDPKVIASIQWDKFEPNKRYVSQTFLGSTSENNSTLVNKAGRKSLWLRAVD